MAGAEGDHPACTSEARKAGDTAPDGSTYLARREGNALSNPAPPWRRDERGAGSPAHQSCSFMLATEAERRKRPHGRFQRSRAGGPQGNALIFRSPQSPPEPPE